MNPTIFAKNDPTSWDLHGGESDVILSKGWPKNGTFFVLFSFVKYWPICNNTITKDLTTPQVCRYTTSSNVSVLKQHLNTRFL